MNPLEGFEGGGVFLEVERDFADGAVTVFGDEDIDDVFVRSVGFDAVFAVEEEHDVSVLFDGTGFAEVGEFGHLVLAALYSTRELGECDDRDIEFAGELLQSAGDLGNLLHAIVAPTATTLHQLQIVDDDEAEFVFGLEAACHSAHLHNID